MVQSYINKYFFFLLLFSLVFVIIFYHLINFQFLDELTLLAVVVLFLYGVFNTREWAFNKVFLLTLGIFVFYAIYSIAIGSNTKAAIINDMIIQLKPYLAFFCVYQLRPLINDGRKKLMNDILLLFWFIFLLPVGLAGGINEHYFEPTIAHPAFYGIAITLVGMTYLYCSNFTLKEKVAFIALLSIGILCGRSKFYGFFVIASFLIVFFSKERQIKLSFKNILLFAGVAAVMFFVAWEKIYLYFFQAFADDPDIDKDMIARFVIYRTMPEILMDYIPFGSGFASFATYSSGLYYSPIYTKYGIEHVYGITQSDPAFISDTFYPALAQFGFAGIALYIIFWIFIFVKALKFFKKNPAQQRKYLLLVIMIIGFLAIEGTTGSTFIAQGGLYVMMLLGLVLADMERINREHPCIK